MYDPDLDGDEELYDFDDSEDEEEDEEFYIDPDDDDEPTRAFSLDE